jgi:pyruvate,water dikinase
MKPYIIPFERLKNKDIELVGGKNASIGEMISGLATLGVSVPGGFATTSHAYRDFLAQDGLDERIGAVLATLDVDDVERLSVVGAQIRGWMLATPFPKRLHDEILDAWRAMGKASGAGGEFAVAVRSSATAEDLPEASFAGQQETFLNVRGEEHLMTCVHEVYASLFNDRAISYRVHNKFDHSAVALSVGIQHMVRSDLGSAGVMFTLDTDSGFRDVVFITAAYGLGETVVQGAVNPDEFYVYKTALRAGRRSVLRKNLGGKAIKMIYGEPGSKQRVRTVDVAPADRNRFCLDEADIVELAKQALIIEQHYGTPMDIEWGKDGATGKIYILQARPETVQSRAGRTILRFTLKARSKLVVTGRSIGQRIGAGNARIIKDVKEMSRVRAGDVLVADMTDPDWEPRASSAYRRSSAAAPRPAPSRRVRRSRSPAPKATRATSTTACSNTISAALKWIPCRRFR